MVAIMPWLWPWAIPCRLTWWHCTEQMVASETGTLPEGSAIGDQEPRHDLPQQPLVLHDSILVWTKSSVPTGVPKITPRGLHTSVPNWAIPEGTLRQRST